MSKEVTVTPICPNHDERVVATVETTLSANGTGPTKVDMCADCAQMLDVIMLFIEDGEPVGVKPKRGGGAGRRPSAPGVPDTECPECHRSGFSSRHTRNSHLRDAHNKSIREYA